MNSREYRTVTYVVFKTKAKFFALLLSCLVSGCSSVREGEIRKSPVNLAEDFIGAWTGFSDDMNYMLRLDFHLLGKGVFAAKFLDRPARFYPIQSWDLRHDKIRIQFESIAGAYETLHVSIARLSWNRIDLVTSGVYNGSEWQRSGRLFRHSFLKQQLDALEDDLRHYIEE